MTNEELDLIDPIDIDNIDSYLTKDKSLAKKRRFDVTKALRKRSIAHSYALFVYTGWYDNLHQYSKNKIHCSCPMCAAKTNNKRNKSRGPVCGSRGVRVPNTCSRYGKKTYTMSDKKKIDSMRYQLAEEIKEIA